MKLYEGEYLLVAYEKGKNRFIQFWIESPSSLDEFKEEMLAYKELYLKHKPTQSMWLQQNFQLDLDEPAQHWIEQNVNIPCKKAGNKQLAFVISENILVHMKVIGAFEKTQSCITPHHFATQEGAEKWLDSMELPKKGVIDDFSISYNGTSPEGVSQLTVTTNSGEVLNVIKLFENLMEEAKFIKENLKKFLSLTEREKEVLMYRSKGMQLDSIAIEMNVSIYTARTHWRNVKRKLNIFSIIEAGKYVNAFLNA